MNGQIHFRRCHVCGKIESIINKRVEKCGDCGKHLAPFFYFDESKVAAVDESFNKSSSLIGTSEDSYLPIRGLSTYW